MTITPQPVPEGRKERKRYAWSLIQPGEWQNWLDLTCEDVDDEEAMLHCTRIRLAATDHARRHGMKVQSRRRDHGRVLDLRFTIG